MSKKNLNCITMFPLHSARGCRAMKTAQPTPNLHQVTEQTILIAFVDFYYAILIMFRLQNHLRAQCDKPEINLGPTHYV